MRKNISKSVNKPVHTKIKPIPVTHEVRFGKIGIICKKSIPQEVDKLERVLKFLEKFDRHILLDKHAADALNLKHEKKKQWKKVKGFSKLEICAEVDMIVTLGGDGTLLKTARCLSKPETTVFAINVGNLGFLTEATLKDFEKKLTAFLKGKYVMDPRSLLHITLKRKNGTLFESLALNDAVINQGSFARLIKMSVKIDDLDAALFKADGLVIATPTGSTGHSLSAGGPIVHARVGGFVITPICPALLSMRPIIIPDERTIHVRIETERREEQIKIGLTIDGQNTIGLDYGDEVIIKKAPQHMDLIRAVDRNYYEILNRKLHWGREG